MTKPKEIRWNDEYQTYEAIYPDGYIEPLRDDIEAQKLAEMLGMEVCG